MQYTDLSPEERDRLRAAYEAGFTAGSGGAWMMGDDPALIALTDAVADDWFLSLETRQAADRARYAFPDSGILPAPPEWLRAEWERHAALGDAQPPDSWHTAPLKGVRP